MDMTVSLEDLRMMGDTDQRIVASLIAHLKKLGAMEKPPATEAELYWQEVAGLKDHDHSLAAPLWEELAGLQMEPSKNFKRISQLKLRLRALGEI